MELAREDLARAEERIRSILGESSSPQSPAKLFERLAGEDVSEFLVRAAVWYLIDRDEVELTRDRRLLLATRARDEDRREPPAPR